MAEKGDPSENPAKRAGLEGYGLRVIGRVALPVHATVQNLRYLQTKRDRMGHELPHDLSVPDVMDLPEIMRVPGVAEAR